MKPTPIKNAPTLESEGRKMQVKIKEMRNILGHKKEKNGQEHLMMTEKVAHSVDLEKEMQLLEEEIALEKKKRAKDSEEWRKLVEESDSITAELMETFADLKKSLEKKSSNGQHTPVTALQTAPMMNAEAIIPNLNQITSGPLQGLIEPAGSSGLEKNGLSASPRSNPPVPTRERSSSVIFMETEEETDLQRLQKRMGHEIHPISFMMAQCPRLDPETGRPYEVSRATIVREMSGPSSEEDMIISPCSPSIVSIISSATPKPLDEYLSSSSVSTPSYQPVQIQTSATQTDAPPPVHTQGTQTEIQPPHSSQASQTEVFIFKIKK